MPNIKVGGKVYRDVEKLDLDGLHAIRVAAVNRMQVLLAEGKKLNPRAHSSVFAMGRIDAEMKELNKRLAIVDGFAKNLVAGDVDKASKEHQAKQVVEIEPVDVNKRGYNGGVVQTIEC